MSDSRATPSSEAPGKARQTSRLLGEQLVAQELLTPAQLEQALAFQRAKPGARLGKIAVELGFTTEMQVCAALAAQLNIPAAELSAVDVSRGSAGKGPTRDGRPP